MTNIWSNYDLNDAGPDAHSYHCTLLRVTEKAEVKLIGHSNKPIPEKKDDPSEPSHGHLRQHVFLLQRLEILS